MFAHAIVFVPLLALAAISLYVVLVFAAHYFLTLVECTAQGQREVQWPGEMFTEWLLKPVHLGWLAGLYLLPAVLLAGKAGQYAGTPYLTIALTALAFALLFPFAALSAFIANSVWIPFHPRSLPLMLSKPGTTLGFFIVGFLAALVGVGGVFLALFSKEIGTLGAVAGGLLAALAWFVYACALGRLLFALTYVAPPPKKTKRRKAAEVVKAPIPPLLQEEEAKPHWEREKPAWRADEDDSPYAAHNAEVVTREAMPEIAKPKESEMKLLEKEPPPPPPGNPFGTDAFSPMFQNETMRNAIVLAVMFMLQSGLVRLLIDMNPAK